MSIPRSTASSPWWARPGLEVREGRLAIAGRDAEHLARERGTPLYAHDLLKVREQVESLQRALRDAGLRGLVRLALKAQREPELLAFLRDLGPAGSSAAVGLDVCSPAEIAWAAEHGWSSQEISYTGTNVSAADLDEILASGVHLNVDLCTQLERVGRAAPGSTVGVRVNPEIGASFDGSDETLYTGGRPTKFGVYAEEIPRALEIAKSCRLTIDTVHFHVGDGYLTDGLDVFEESVRRVAAMTKTFVEAGCPIVEVNTGGGLGVPQGPGDEPLDVKRWADILARHLGGFDVVVSTEPGDYLVKESAVHLAEVVTVEDRRGRAFVGLDTGWGVMGERFIYGVLLDFALCRDVNAPATRSITISGNINEGDDLFAVDYPFPEVREGDIVAAIGVGSYNASMTSVHCLRNTAKSVHFKDRTD